MKKIIYIFTALLTLGASSCSDMLDVESPNQLSNQDINSKTDSVFYTFGVMNAMQQLADAYVLQNELRGDLVSTTLKSDKNLTALANFTADSSNSYDSAYVYYKVINNVNYYAAHRDTTLKDGSTNVVAGEYAAMLSFRAWAYLQAVRTFGSVKYFTHPLTTISDIENDASPVLGIEEVVRNLISDLEPYSGTPVPNYGVIDCGRTNKGSSKTAISSRCFIPVDVILGDLYLELGDEASCLKAVEHYYRYLVDNKQGAPKRECFSFNLWNEDIYFPQDFSITSMVSSWNIYGTTDVITYIPMAANRLTGTTTALPKIFGYDYYSTDSSYISDIQIVASETYHTLADSSDYYYVSTDDVVTKRIYKSFKAGDMRRLNTIYVPYSDRNGGEALEYIDNYYQANVALYRVSTIWLHLAEALNRAGYPDAAFAVLKDGLSSSTAERSYISDATRTLLGSTFFSYDNDDIFGDNVGIHGYGCGVDGITGEYSPYQYTDTLLLPSGEMSVSIVKEKMNELADEFGITIGETKADTINAVEDLICDEYAMELPFTGSRYSDLMRMARHKNAAGLYGSNFGSIWLDRKIRKNNPNLAKDLTNEQNWYLPFN